MNREPIYRNRPAASAAAATTTAAPPAARPGLVLLVMCAGMFLVLLDVTVVNVAVPAITTGLGTGTAGIQWVVDGYTVALASLLLAGGALGDRLGHRRVVLRGLVIFGAASAGCALAPSASVLVAARVVQGIGAALLLPGSVAAIADAYPGRAEQARALGTWAAVSAIAVPAGPLLGGFLVQSYGWRSVFWINPPVIAVCLVGVIAWVKAAPGRRERRLDLGGLVLGTTGLAALVYAVIAASGNGAAAIAAAVIGALALAGFVTVERRAADPLLPPGVFKVPAFTVANGSALVMNLTSGGLIFLLTRYLQQVHGRTALQAGVMLLPLFVPLSALSLFAGRLTARYGARPVMLGAALVAAAGQLCLLLVSVSAGYPRLVPALIGVGLGVAMFTAPVVATAIRSVPPERSGIASGVNNTARQAGTALGVAVFGAVAGNPANAGHFVAAMRGLGVAAAALWLVVALATATGIKKGAS
jgi:MFS transporter, DHA2 family, methylenomycin A resistance protein